MKTDERSNDGTQVSEKRAYATSLMREGELQLTARHLDQAVSLLTRAAEGGADPDRCCAGLWTAYMLSGEFEAAWQQSDSIRRRGAADPHRFWQGEPLEGKRVIVRFLHGYGDAVQFLRYAVLLRHAAAEIIIEVPPRLVALARYFDGVDKVITWEEEAPTALPGWDVQVEGNELPYLFRTKLSDLPLAVRYLSISRGHERSYQSQLSNASTISAPLRVGLSWKAGEWNPTRSIPLELLTTLLDSKGCEFWNLQEKKLLEDEKVATVTMMQDDSSRESIYGLAHTITQLDLVITVDTLAAHLAGALGIKAWVLLQHEADWRWLYDRSDSPWYPSLRLFRQPEAGDWKSVLSDVELELAKWVDRHSSARNEAMPAGCS